MRNALALNGPDPHTFPALLMRVFFFMPWVVWWTDLTRQQQRARPGIRDGCRHGPRCGRVAHVPRHAVCCAARRVG